MVARLYAVEEEAKAKIQELLKSDPTVSIDTRHEIILSLRQEKSQPILTEIKGWLDCEKEIVLPCSPMAQAIGYTLNQWDALCRYAEHGYPHAERPPNLTFGTPQVNFRRARSHLGRGPFHNHQCMPAGHRGTPDQVLMHRGRAACWRRLLPGRLGRVDVVAGKIPRVPWSTATPSSRTTSAPRTSRPRSAVVHIGDNVVPVVNLVLQAQYLLVGGPADPGADPDDQGMAVTDLHNPVHRIRHVMLINVAGGQDPEPD